MFTCFYLYDEVIKNYKPVVVVVVVVVVVNFCVQFIFVSIPTLLNLLTITSEFSNHIFWPKFCMYFSSLPRPSHPPWLITLTIFGEVYKLWSSSLCSLLQHPATFAILGPNTLISTLFSDTPIFVPPLVWETKFHIRTKQQGKLIFQVFREEPGCQNILNWMVSSIYRI
jgi:hypothetical protein